MAVTDSAAAPALKPETVVNWLERVRDFVASSDEAKACAQRAIEMIQQHGELLQALREVEGDHIYLNLDERPGHEECIFCLAENGEHEPECTMRFVFAAIAAAEGKSGR